MDSSSEFTKVLGVFFIELLLITLNMSQCASSKLCKFSAIFNFGDSNSDTGAFVAAFGPFSPPYGQTFQIPARRCCDGRLIVDFLAEGLGLPYLHAYLDSVEANFSHGANFATTGSTILPQGSVLPLGGYSPFYLNLQYTQFTQLKNNSVRFFKQKGAGGIFKDLLPSKEYYSQALYTFDIGQNDLTVELFSNKSMLEIKSFIPNIINNFSQVVKFLYNEGGRSFWIQNTGPIGCLPAPLVNFRVKASQKDAIGCAIIYNDLCQYFNKKLKDAIVQLRRNLPLAAITYVDIYLAKYTLISQANNYGFELPLVACCGYGGEHNYSNGTRCGGTLSVNDTQILVGSCDNPLVRVNWDGVHYTEAANKWIYDQIKNGNFSDPPVALNMACMKQAD